MKQAAEIILWITIVTWFSGCNGEWQEFKERLRQGQGQLPGETPPSTEEPPSVTPRPEPTLPPPTSGTLCAGLKSKSGVYSVTFSHLGSERKTQVSIPSTYSSEKGSPLIVSFHGLGGNGLQHERNLNMNKLANARGYITAHPDGLNNSWNAGTCCGNRDGDDVDFFRTLVTTLSKELCIDPSRIYVTGLSNGGFMSYRLACEASELIAAAAPIAGTIGVANCLPKRPVSILHLHGTDDTLVKYEGSSLGPGAVEATERWADLNACPEKTEVLVDKGNWLCEQAKDCSAKSEVTLCTVDQGSHTGPWHYSSGSTVIATDVILDFFDRN
ncbi:MAG: hypothetical protein H6624_17250 [Bdellovibrionaceae bacterium]|nr:hypothetical protein [Bdellovibrionales bacterium]MCB9086090.1 hypothetical protein [Pseudobdellovibrionaceae bacterium]